MSRNDEKWWEKMRREEDEYRSEVSYRCWQAGVGADQHPDEVSNAFNRGVSASGYVDAKVREQRQREQQAHDEQEAQWEAQRQMADDWSEARHIVEDGGCCSCHISPPCGFCTGMDEEEFEVYIDSGLKGLRALWAARDAGGTDGTD